MTSQVGSLETPPASTLAPRRRADYSPFVQFPHDLRPVNGFRACLRGFTAPIWIVVTRKRALVDASAGETSSDIGALARGGALNLVGVAMSGALQFLLVVIVTRGAGARGAGLFLEAIALFTILSNAGELGADTGVVRMIPHLRALGRGRDIERTLAVALVPVGAVGILFAGAVYISAPQLSHVFFHGVHRGDAAAYVRALAPFLAVGSAATVALAATRGFGTMVPYVTIQNIVLPVLRIALVGLAVGLGIRGTALAWGWGLPLALTLAAGLVALARRLQATSRDADARFAGAPASTHALAAEFWRFVGPRGLAAILGITVTWVDVLLVGALRSTREAGVYAAASRLAIVGAYALQAVGMALAPQISALLARERLAPAQQLYQLGTWWLMALTWPAYIVLALYAPFMMQMFGHEFGGGATALSILSIAMLVNLGTGNVNVVLLMSGKSMWNLINGLGSVVLNVGLNLILIPRFGMSGAAVAWAASIVCVNVATMLEVQAFLGIRPFGRGYPVVATAALGSFGIVGGVLRYGFGASGSTLLITLAAALVVYVALLWRYGRPLRLGGLLGTLPIRVPALARSAGSP